MYKIFVNVISISFVVSIFIILFKILSPVFQKIAGARVKQFIWIILALRLAVPFAFSNLGYEIKTINNDSSVQMLMDFTDEDYSDIYIEHPGFDRYYGINNDMLHYRVTPKDDFISTLIGKFVYWYDIKQDKEEITTLYFVGVAVFLFGHLITYFFFKCKLDYYSREVFTEVDKSILAKIAGEIGVDKLPGVFFSSHIRGPMVVGVCEPTIYIPDIDYTEEELKSIFRHELIHIKHKDLWLKKLYLLVNAIHWFNPLCYLMTSAAGKDMELFCDEQVVKKYSLEERNQYNRILLKFAELGSKRNYGEKYFSSDYLGRVKEMKSRFRNNVNMGRKTLGIPIFITIALVVFISSEYMIARVRTDKNVFLITDKMAVSEYYFYDFTNKEMEVAPLTEAPSIKIYCEDVEITEYECEKDYEEKESVITNEADTFFAKQVKEDIPIFELLEPFYRVEVRLEFKDGTFPDEVKIEDVVLNEEGHIKYNQRDRVVSEIEERMFPKNNYISFNVGGREDMELYVDEVDYYKKLASPVFRGFYVTCYWRESSDSGKTNMVRYKFVICVRNTVYDDLVE